MMKKFVLTKLDESKYLSNPIKNNDFEKEISKFIYKPEEEPEQETTSKSKPELSKEQQEAYDKFTNGENLFITGPGGTGKTKLVNHLVEYSSEINKKTQVCALTGCAAVLLGNKARTIHSWSGIKLAKGKKEKIIADVLKNKKAVKEWKSINCLILDEVSMLSKKIFEILEEIARKARNKPQIFGGMQVIFLGDFFQLPPIESENDPDTERFCFESPIWDKLFSKENHIQLTKIFRQTDPIYIDILMQIRKGELDIDKTKILESYVKREYDEEKNNGIVPTNLFALRAKTDYINSQMFSKIGEKEYVNDAIIKIDCTTYLDTGKVIPIELIERCNRLSIEEKEYEIENLFNTSTCAKILRFKKGAAVMCTVNLDMDNGICNGAQGKIIDILENQQNEQNKEPIIIVKFSNGITKRIEPKYWQSDEYPKLAIGNYPLMLAWALTIHKIQGATLSLAEIDVGNTVFEYGQSYVALSRIQSLEGLYLSAFNPNKIRANPIVKEFYANISKKEPSKEPINNNKKFNNNEDNQNNNKSNNKSNNQNVKVLKNINI